MVRLVEAALLDLWGAERRALEALLASSWDEDGDLAPGLVILQRRSEHTAPLVVELGRLEREGRLTASVAQIAPTLIHMQVNRLIRSSPRAHELVLLRFAGSTHAKATEGRGQSCRWIAAVAFDLPRQRRQEIRISVKHGITARP